MFKKILLNISNTSKIFVSLKYHSDTLEIFVDLVPREAKYFIQKLFHL